MAYDISHPEPGRTLTGSPQGEASVLGLQRNLLLEGLELPALQQLARHCRWRRFAAYQQIISREADDRDVYLIIAGRVRVTAYSARGRQVLFGDKNTGEWFGDFAALDGRSRSADVLALQDTLLAAMKPEVFRKLMHEHPAVCERVLRRLLDCVRDLTERVFEVTTLDVQNRLRAELLRLACQAGVKANAARLDPAPRHADLAGHISTNREEVTRALAAMFREGLVRKDGAGLVIPDVARLEKIVVEGRGSA
jgi:CRP/FNR family transcriptional regulator, cyclic AMP receptor protein